MADVNPYWQNYIDDAWIDGGAGRIEVTDPATSEKLAEHALAYVADVNRTVQAARRVHRSGAFLEPPVLSGVTPEIEIAQQEVFGPVLSVLSFHDDAQAIEIANGTVYRLVAGVFTADLDRATRAARHLRADQVFVNEWYAGGVETPFGGYGKSGYGREALWNFVQTENTAIRLKG